MISLPVYPELTPEQQDAVIAPSGRSTRMEHAMSLAARTDRQGRNAARRSSASSASGTSGCPLAVELADAGYRVLGYDVSQRVVDRLNAGQSHVKDITDAAAAGGPQERALRGHHRLGRLGEPDAISICVPTPLSKFKDPDVSFIVAATEAVQRTLRKGQVDHPGEHDLPGHYARGDAARRWRAPGSRWARISSCRSAPSASIRAIRSTARGTRPRWSAASRPTACGWPAALYQPAIETLVPVSTTEAAELVKLLENTFRTVNIGLVNEMAIVCDKLGVDVWEVIEAAATKPFGFMKFLPGPRTRRPLHPDRPALPRVEDARAELQDAVHRPGRRGQHRDADVLGPQGGRGAQRRGRSVRGAAILVLGVAYKRDIDDLRESPALDIIRLLEQQGAHGRVPRSVRGALLEDGQTMHSVPLTPEALKAADCVMVVTDHTGIDYALVQAPRPAGRRHPPRDVEELARCTSRSSGAGTWAWWPGPAWPRRATTSSAPTSTRPRSPGCRRNDVPIYEPGLEPMIRRNQAEGRLSFTHRHRRGGRAGAGGVHRGRHARRARTARRT